MANTECDLGDDVAKKKKKMTKAQAAAARYDQTEEAAKRARARENQQLIRKSYEIVKKGNKTKKRKMNVFEMKFAKVFPMLIAKAERKGRT